MPTWSCDSFVKKPVPYYVWENGVENCGMCAHWNGEKCAFHEELKEQGENDWYEEDDNDFGFSRVNTEWNSWEWSSDGKA